MRWALERGDRILFLPDQHLGRNTGYRLGLRLEEMPVWDPYEELGGNIAEILNNSRVVLWKGHCSVHQRFLPQHVAQVRSRFPGIRVIAHPECRFEVVQLADDSGSTEHIIKCLTQAPAGTKWAVGTEIHLVNRLMKWVFFVRDLPQAPNGRVYQLWFVPKVGMPVSAKVFNTESNGLYQVDILLPGGLNDLKAAAVTIEPEPGQPQPTGPFALLGAGE